MVNPRAVANPFTKNENHMRRNTKNNKWVAVDSEHTYTQRRAGPSRPVQIRTQQSQHLSHIPSMSTISDEVSQKPRIHNPPPLRTKSSSPGSGATVFPYYPSTITKPEPRPKQSWWKQGFNISDTPPKVAPGKNTTGGSQTVPSITDLYRTAKEIYQVGPEGEGLKVWRDYKQSRKGKQNQTEAKQDKSTAQVYQKSRTTPPVPAAPLRPLPGQVYTGFEADKVIRRGPYAQKDSRLSEGEFSRSSCEVPIAIDKSVQRVVDTNKPLPPVPLLQAAPKTRHPMDLETAFRVGIAAASIQHPTQQRVGNQGAESDQHVPKDAHSGPWWKSLADKHSAKAHDGLKAKISHRGPLTAFNDGRTVHVAAGCNRVGGPAAAIPRPVNHNGVPTTQSAQAKKNQSMGTKGKKRKSSDASFACQGLADTSFPASQSAMHDDKELVPEPLFSGARAGDEGMRDSMFYEPYYDVLNEY
ncbi:uncharacterized protein K460DRAFT_286434 [Cucurbitaria berberidis CBS 394.84]|uniref:Uncharacterized protein n=1 Tax=Cucurbitaria berberidis CBS 394.84 TaxID=1168544 RepID=A0A9P4GHG7_9PLEO|nr:uncharacterized protein K460DRAFT_286434 [Cucurbitaria berberidis CBS 394.84]KAF1845655.1 hypothetical protein K460DRAFT_286434 [Cucurbitaria berberidis CBS 394.84]